MELFINNYIENTDYIDNGKKIEISLEFILNINKSLLSEKKTLKNNKSLLLVEIYKKNFYEINKILNELGYSQIKRFKERSNYFYSNFIN